IMLLSAVGDGVIEPPGFVGKRDQFIAAIQDRAVAFVFPKNWVGAFERFSIESGFETDAFVRGNRFAVELGWILRAGDIEASGHDVNEMTRLRFEPASARGRDTLGPMRD